jgi:hypothetical protein
MDDKPLFQGMDEFERTYAPEQLPEDDPARARVRADEGGDAPTGAYEMEEPPSPAPVAGIASSPSAQAAPPNTGHEDRGGGPGDPETEAGYPMDDRDNRSDT